MYYLGYKDVWGKKKIGTEDCEASNTMEQMATLRDAREFAMQKAQ